MTALEKFIKQIVLNQVKGSVYLVPAIYDFQITDALEEEKKQGQKLNIQIVNSCYAVFDEEDNIVQLYQTQDKANKGMEEFKRSHEHTEFYVDTMQIN